jgi:hypothetical protein
MRFGKDDRKIEVMRPYMRPAWDAIADPTVPAGWFAAPSPQPDARRVKGVGGSLCAAGLGRVVVDSNNWPVRGQDGSVAMTLEQARKSIRRDETPFVRTPRLRLKPKAPRSGYVDGAWWPRSDDLTTELPDLIGVMSFRLGVIDRVTYNLGEWTRAPAELATGGRAVHIDGDQRHQPNTVQVLDANRNKIVLLVVPWHTEPDHAHTIVMAAAAPNNASSVDSLLMISEQERESRTRITAARQRRESRDGTEGSTSRHRHRPRRRVFWATSRSSGNFAPQSD